MAFDIMISDSHNKVERGISLFMEDWNLIMERINSSNEFPLLKKSISDYYGDSEIFITQLTALRNEVNKFYTSYSKNAPEGLGKFILDFVNLIDFAIDNRKTIQFVGD